MIHLEERVISPQSFHTACTAQNISIHLEKMGTFLERCKIYIFLTFFGAFKLVFLLKFFNQEVQFSIKFKNIPKKPFEKSLRNISIHLKLLITKRPTNIYDTCWHPKWHPWHPSKCSKQHKSFLFFSLIRFTKDLPGDAQVLRQKYNQEKRSKWQY